MSHIFKDTGHMRDICGTSAGHVRGIYGASYSLLAPGESFKEASRTLRGEGPFTGSSVSEDANRLFLRREGVRPI